MMEKEIQFCYKANISAGALTILPICINKSKGHNHLMNDANIRKLVMSGNFIEFSS